MVFFGKFIRTFQKFIGFFFTKNHNKEKTDKKSIVPEPSIISNQDDIPRILNDEDMTKNQVT